jgi:hypothetical protein
MTGYPPVPRPAVGFSIEVPDHWVVVDLNPETREAWVDAFLAERLAATGQAVAAADRSAARAALVDLLRQLQAGEVFMAAILCARVDRQVISASATLAWRHLGSAGPVPLDGLAAVYRDAPPAAGEDRNARRIEVVDLLAGGSVKVVTGEALAGAPAVAVTQYFVPVAETGWLAVITGTTGEVALGPSLEAVIDEVAASLTFDVGAGSR